MGIAIGALWEVAEWRVGIVLSTAVIESLNDTIIDLIMDSLGAAIAALMGLGTLQEWMGPRAAVGNQVSIATSIYCQSSERSHLTQSNIISFSSIIFHQVDIFLWH